MPYTFKPNLYFFLKRGTLYKAVQFKESTKKVKLNHYYCKECSCDIVNWS